jgi:hypothetical protein
MRACADIGIGMRQDSHRLDISVEETAHEKWLLRPNKQSLDKHAKVREKRRLSDYRDRYNQRVSQTPNFILQTQVLRDRQSMLLRLRYFQGPCQRLANLSQ